MQLTSWPGDPWEIDSDRNGFYLVKQNKLDRDNYLTISQFPSAAPSDTDSDKIVGYIDDEGACVTL